MLESSPKEFAQGYAQYAAHGWLLPRLEGSFSMEFACGGLVLYLVDRSGPYTPAGPAAVVVHGVTEAWSSVPSAAVPSAAVPGPAVPGAAAQNPDADTVGGPGGEKSHSSLEPWADAVGRTQLQGGGLVLARTRRGTVVDVGFPVVLSRAAYPPYTPGCWALDVTPGTWLEFVTTGPLHGYLADRP